jgi:hypothetical protein
MRSSNLRSQILRQRCSSYTPDNSWRGLHEERRGEQAHPQEEKATREDGPEGNDPKQVEPGVTPPAPSVPAGEEADDNEREHDRRGRAEEVEPERHRQIVARPEPVGERRTGEERQEDERGEWRCEE